MYKRNQARRFCCSSCSHRHHEKLRAFLKFLKTSSIYGEDCRLPNFTSEWRPWIEFMQVYCFIQVETDCEKSVFRCCIFRKPISNFHKVFANILWRKHFYSQKLHWSKRLNCFTAKFLKKWCINNCILVKSRKKLRTVVIRFLGCRTDKMEWLTEALKTRALRITYTQINIQGTTVFRQVRSPYSLLQKLDEGYYGVFERRVWPLKLNQSLTKKQCLLCITGRSQWILLFILPRTLEVVTNSISRLLFQWWLHLSAYDWSGSCV